MFASVSVIFGTFVHYMGKCSALKLRLKSPHFQQLLSKIFNTIVPLARFSMRNKDVLTGVKVLKVYCSKFLKTHGREVNCAKNFHQRVLKNICSKYILYSKYRELTGKSTLTFLGHEWLITFVNNFHTKNNLLQMIETTIGDTWGPIY